MKLTRRGFLKLSGSMFLAAVPIPAFCEVSSSENVITQALLNPSIPLPITALTDINNIICSVHEAYEFIINKFEVNDARTQSYMREGVYQTMQEFQSRRQIYDFAVVCDDSNNPVSVIDSNDLILDVAIKVFPFADAHLRFSMQEDLRDVIDKSLHISDVILVTNDLNLDVQTLAKSKPALCVYAVAQSATPSDLENLHSAICSTFFDNYRSHKEYGEDNTLMGPRRGLLRSEHMSKVNWNSTYLSHAQRDAAYARGINSFTNYPGMGVCAWSSFAWFNGVLYDRTTITSFTSRDISFEEVV
jgi:hypothetical protein